MTKDDLRERQEARDMLKELYFVVIGDKDKGMEGMVGKQQRTLERIAAIEEKLKSDHELLWWNRTANGVIDVIKRPVLYLITFATIVAIVSGNGIKGAWEYMIRKYGG